MGRLNVKFLYQLFDELKSMKKQLEYKMIKNVIFDVDGVLVDCDQCYLNFLQKTYKEFQNITYDELPVIFPISPDNGAVRLSPRFSDEFKSSPYYSYRPLFKETMQVLHSLKKKELRLFTLSAARNPARKRKWMDEIFGNIFDGLEFSPSGEPKDKALIDLLEKYSLNKEETIFIDDRFHNIRAGMKVGIRTVRMHPQNSLPLPAELSHIKSLNNLTEFEKYIDELNSRGS